MDVQNRVTEGEPEIGVNRFMKEGMRKGTRTTMNSFLCIPLTALNKIPENATLLGEDYLTRLFSQQKQQDGLFVCFSDK